MLYIRSIMPDKEVTDVLEISMQQLARWVQDGNWTQERKNNFNTKTTQLRLCYDQLATLNLAISQGAGFPDEKQSLTQRRLTASINDLEKEVSLAEIINVAEVFCSWMMDNDHDLGVKAFDQFDEFIHLKASGSDRERIKRRRKREKQEKENFE